jgi:hypothetical protein
MLLCIPDPNKQIKNEIANLITNTLDLSKYCIELLTPEKETLKHNREDKAKSNIPLDCEIVFYTPIRTTVNTSPYEPYFDYQMYRLMSAQDISEFEMKEAVHILMD